MMVYGLLSLRGLRTTATLVPVAAGMAMASGGIYAQESGLESSSERTVTIEPRVSITETLTDNVNLSSASKKSALITEVSPGIRMNIAGARLKGYFDYALNQILYSEGASPNRSQNALNTFGTLEAIDNWAFIDLSGSISQQAVSAFGTQSIDNTSVNANRTEVSNYRISPYVRGRLGDWASYDARYSRAVTNTDAAGTSGFTTVDGVVNFKGDSAFTKLGWSADVSQQRVDFNAGRATDADRFSLGLFYSITPQLKVSANAGREANNYTTLDKQNFSTSGVGVDWSPSEMTRLSASRDRRSFGDAHRLSFEHRTARTAWRFSDIKDASATPNQTVVGSLGSIYDLLYSQFASLEPNPTARAQLVNAFLLANGISPNAVVVSSFLTSALSLQRRQDLSFALLGVRDTITFIATKSESSRLDTVSTGVDDFNRSDVVRQRGFSVNYAHRLTPDFSLGVLASQQRTSGVSSLQDSTIRFLNVSITGKVGKQATVSVGVRHVISRGTSPYVENAITANLIVRF
ncbi:uncharacterized protein, PEP-CTERM system associated [Polaromonas sp. OV174]|uniref:TIGR03016 family PEP-CTERM system-associated outer membrane protein n=1 Tax=Polaromonas sp. OV174 TaxID=1855300 RepID=UPI0008EDBA10|nr:TIGR03016 family PEP-CTERM system-associated outer membrane protein [Polaromonas sp. OV174]SFC65898.1 uncharacterized protein, PEP-CTERM system associated [Polaromonas sp. OV174]